MSNGVRRRQTCRLCNSPRVELALPIAASPIADAYVPVSRLGEPQETYPLDLYLCQACGHVQNLDVVDPATLFRDYLFTTSSSGGLVEHFRRYAADVVSTLGMAPGSLVVEIGSNDGTLLGFFKEHGMRTLGVDPAREIAMQATRRGIETLAEFFGLDLARQIRASHGPASVVTANNVFAHMDDLADTVSGVREVLADDGIFVFEVSYLVDIVDRYLFDTVYHEHVSYHSIKPLAQFMERHGMQLVDVHRIASKGGSIRGFAQRRPEGRRPVQPVVPELIALEESRGFDRLPTYRDYGRRIDERSRQLNEFLDAQLAAGRMVAGYGASTTTTTLMWHFGLTRKLGFIVDDNPKKHGLYSPGCHIPIVPSSELYIRRPDVTVILAWNYAAPILARHARYMAEGGAFVVPLIDFKVHGPVAGQR